VNVRVVAMEDAPDDVGGRRVVMVVVRIDAVVLLAVLFEGLLVDEDAGGEVLDWAKTVGSAKSSAQRAIDHMPG
jgi:hypothetical protein